MIDHFGINGINGADLPVAAAPGDSAAPGSPSLTEPRPRTQHHEPVVGALGRDPSGKSLEVLTRHRHAVA